MQRVYPRVSSDICTGIGHQSVYSLMATTHTRWTCGVLDVYCMKS